MQLPPRMIANRRGDRAADVAFGTPELAGWLGQQVLDVGQDTRLVSRSAPSHAGIPRPVKRRQKNCIQNRDDLRGGTLTDPASRLSPRQRDCLYLVWSRQLTSKEIAVELSISKPTVDGYIAEAVKELGARDRREAAAIAFGGAPRPDAPDNMPRAASGGDSARVATAPWQAADPAPSTNPSTIPLPFRTRSRPRNSLLLGQTLAWIAAIAIGSLAALALATSVGNGLPAIAKPGIDAVRRLTH